MIKISFSVTVKVLLMTSVVGEGTGTTIVTVEASAAIVILGGDK